MKATLIIIISLLYFNLLSLVTNAQETNPKSNTAWIISKDVQKIANKKKLENSYSRAIRSIGHPAAVVSKGVHKIKMTSQQEVTAKGNMPSKGSPNWIVSKEVHRLRRHK